MASLALGAIGGYLFGPIGFAIGSLIGNLLFPQKQEGPRLTDLKLHNSGYGLMVPIVYGAMRVPGIVIDMTDLQEHEHDSGGKGGPEATTFTYSASFAEYLCEGPIVSIRKIWANGTIIYDANNPDISTLPCTLYVGDEDQLPDPTFEAIHGVGNVPAYRGMAYVVFDDWDLSPYGNTIPNLNYEVTKKGFDDDLHIVKAKYDNTYAIGDMVILNWPTSGNITAGTPDYEGGFTASTSTCTPQLYDEDLNYLNPEPSPTFSWPVRVGNTMYYQGLGIYVHTDLSEHPLWYQYVNDYPVSNVDTAQPIIPGGIQISISGHAYVQNGTYLVDAGVPLGEYVHAAALTRDGTKLFVFTSPTTGKTTSPVTKWYRIVDDLVDDQGTVDPPIILNAFGIVMTTTAQGAVNSVANFEDNARWMWLYNQNNDSVKVYYIDDAGNFADSGLGTLPLQSNNASRPGASIKVISEGYCGYIRGYSMAILSRLSDTAAVTRLSEIVADISDRAGFDASEYDVTALTDIVDGYIITQQQACRDSIVPLQSAYFFDGVESTGVVKFVKRGGDVVETIPDSELAARKEGDAAPALVTVKRLQEDDLPAFLNVKYINPANDYQTGTQPAQRQVVESELKKTIELSIAMDDAKGMQVAKALLYSSWVERMQQTFSVGPKYDYLEPTDVVSVHGYTLRITSKRNVANDVIEFDGVEATTATWTQTPVAVSGSGFSQTTPASTQATAMLLLDIPLIADTDDPNGIYVAVAGATSSTWKGANVYKSTDGGTTYQVAVVCPAAATMGTTSSALDDFLGGNVFDERNTVTVVLGNGGGTLASASDLAVLNGANLALLGDEILQFKNADLIAAGTYILTGFLRGRRGTEFAMPYHFSGERFVLLDAAIRRVPVAFAELGQSRLYKAVSFGTALASATAVPFTSQGAAIRPYSPVHVGGGSDASGNVTINWQRRTRIGGAWADFVDVPLSETSEAYVAQIWNSGFTLVARVISGLTTPTASYTAAQQVTDFGATQEHVYCTVGQVGSFALGTQQKATIPGAGASDVDPSSPVPPYGSPPPQGGSTCPAPVQNDTYPWTLPTPNRIENSDFVPGQTWVIKFTTGAVAGAGSINLYEFGGPPCPRDALLSTSPCGAALPGGLFISNPAPYCHFWVGPGNPHPTQKATLNYSTDYYFCCTTSQVSAAAVTLQHA